MFRRSFLSGTATLAITTAAGCLSSDQNEDGEGPVGSEEAVTHYDNAIELLEKNSDDFDAVRQDLLLDRENPNFSATTITSRTEEARRQLDKAEKEDDGRLEEEIETLRRTATYQDTLAQYNDDYIKLTEYLNTGIDNYSNGNHDSAIATLQNAQQQIEPTESSLNEVSEDLDSVLDAQESAEMGEGFEEDLIIAGDDHAEVREELRWLDQLIPARLDEIRGDRELSSANTAIDSERYSSARSQYSEAENYFVSAKTQLGSLNVDEVTEYIEGLVRDTKSLECQNEHLSKAADKMAQASQAAQNRNYNIAEDYRQDANSHYSSARTC